MRDQNVLQKRVDVNYMGSQLWEDCSPEIRDPTTSIAQRFVSRHTFRFGNPFQS